MKLGSRVSLSGIAGQVAGVAALSTCLVACIIDNTPPRRLDGDRDNASSSGDGTGGTGGTGGLGGIGGGASSGGSTTSGGTTSPSPMLAVIDTDQVMTADPGQGVGVFIEYAKGGRWHVWWTCDTAQTRQDCDFAVNASVAAGTIADVDTTELQGGVSSTPDPSRIEAKVKTTNEVHGLEFTTTPGAVLTVEASVGGLKDGSFLFFVQDGKVKGGFSGVLTNPLQLQGNAP